MSRNHTNPSFPSPKFMANPCSFLPPSSWRTLEKEFLHHMDMGKEPAPCSDLCCTRMGLMHQSITVLLCLQVTCWICPCFDRSWEISRRWKAPHLASLALSRTVGGTATTQHQSRLGFRNQHWKIFRKTHSLVKLHMKGGGRKRKKKESSKTTSSSDSCPAILEGQGGFFWLQNPC